jgi:hypothetical protein
VTARLVALIVLIAGASTTAGADVGRLFFTPEQRAALDHLRRQNVRNTEVSDDESNQDLTSPGPAPEHARVNGVVRRSDDRHTVWINNRAIGAQQPPGINVAPGKNDNRVKLTVPPSGRSFELKVGQAVEIMSGTISDAYARPTLPLSPARVPMASQPGRSSSMDNQGPRRAGEGDAPEVTWRDGGLKPKKP